MQNRFIDKEKLRHVILILILALIGLAVFWKTFQLEIYGDEWEGIWWTTSTLQTKGVYNNRLDYKPYETAAILLNLVSGASSLKYNSTAVYLFSFILRLIAVYFLYLFLIGRKLSTTASFLGSLFFLITPVGIQATDWAKNFTSYISIAFFLLCLDSIYNLTSWKRILIFLSTFLISVYVNPIRSHGIILTTVFLLTIQLIFLKSLYRKNIALSILAQTMIFFLLSKMLIFGEMGGRANYYIQKLILLFNQLFNNNWTKAGDIFILIGRGALPQPSLLYFALFLIILLLWKRYLFSKKYLPFTILVHIILTFIIFFYFAPLSNENITAISGIYLFLFITATFIIEISTKKISDAINTLIPLLLNICFVFTPWIFGNTDVTDSTHRYLIYPALSIPIIVAFSLNENIFKNIKVKMISIGASVILLFMFFFSIKSEIDNLYIRHNQTLAKIIWQQIIPYFDNFDFKNHRAIIFFDSDDQAMLHDVVSFGFGYHVGFIYKVWDYDKLPVAVDSMKDLVSLITDGKAGQKYIQKEAIFPKQDAFYFRIENTKVKKLPI